MRQILTTLVEALSTLPEVDLESVRLFRAHASSGLPPMHGEIDRAVLVRATAELLAYRDRCARMTGRAFTLTAVPCEHIVVEFGL